jgi:Ca2+-binding RTX toxin-like protein
MQRSTGDADMAYNSTGTAGNDILDRSGTSGPGTIVGLAGNDSILTGSGPATVNGDSGSDTVVLQARQYRYGEWRFGK